MSCGALECRVETGVPIIPARVDTMATSIRRLLSRTGGGGQNEGAKKADPGEELQAYYSEALGKWVFPGSENEEQEDDVPPPPPTNLHSAPSTPHASSDHPSEASNTPTAAADSVSSAPRPARSNAQSLERSNAAPPPRARRSIVCSNRKRMSWTAPSLFWCILPCTRCREQIWMPQGMCFLLCACTERPIP